MTYNFKTYVVEWIDASVQTGPLSVDEIDPNCPHAAAGFLVKETEDYLTLGLDYSIQTETWRYLLHIPQSQIVKFYEAYSIPEQGDEPLNEPPIKPEKGKVSYQGGGGMRLVDHWILAKDVLPQWM